MLEHQLDGTIFQVKLNRITELHPIWTQPWTRGSSVLECIAWLVWVVLLKFIVPICAVLHQSSNLWVLRRGSRDAFWSQEMCYLFLTKSWIKRRKSWKVTQLRKRLLQTKTSEQIKNWSSIEKWIKEILHGGWYLTCGLNPRAVWKTHLLPTCGWWVRSSSNPSTSVACPTLSFHKEKRWK